MGFELRKMITSKVHIIGYVFKKSVGVAVFALKELLRVGWGVS